MTPSNEISPQDLQKATTLATGASPSQARDALRDFYNITQAASVAQNSPQPAPYVPPSQPPQTDFSDSLPLGNPDGLDPGIPLETGGFGGGGQGNNPVVVTGVMNGVASSGTAAFVDTPVPL